MNHNKVFECNNCGEAFHAAGLHASVHDQAVIHICPGCLVQSKTIQLTLEREGPGKPYQYSNFLVLDEFTE